MRLDRCLQSPITLSFVELPFGIDLAEQPGA
jgi:hypothetical protein